MMRRISKKIILTIIYGILAVGLFFLFEANLNNLRKKELQEYVTINKNNEGFEGRVIYRKISTVLNGGLLLHLKNTERNLLRLTGKSYNHSYTPSNLKDFIMLNDSIYRPYNTDTIYIYRNNEEFYFIIGKTLH